MRARALLLIAVAVAVVALEAAARPGGGNSYSGGSRSGGSSSGGSSGSRGSSGSSRSSDSGSSSSSGVSSGNYEWMAPFDPWLGHIMFGAFALILVAASFSNRRSGPARRLDVASHEAAIRMLRATPAERPRPDTRDKIFAGVRQHDPDFSLVLFEDFAYTLYAESHRARHDPTALARLGPYWTARPLAALAQRSPQGARVQAVVVGSLQPESLSEADGKLRLQCRFETNLHIDAPAGPAPPAPPMLGGLATAVANLDPIALVHSVKALAANVDRSEAPARARQHGMTQYVDEVWAFSRGAATKTRPWTGVRTLGCPSCGAPFESTADARCQSCGQATGGGRFDWEVAQVVIRSQETREHTLTGTSEEVGTDAATRFAPRVKERTEALFGEDPGVSQASLSARLVLIYETLQRAWQAQDLRAVRPYVSDRLYAYLQYWVEAYQQQGLRNMMERPRFQKFVIARVERDGHYDAVTLRIWAAGCDYTVDVASGSVVGGSRTKDRFYSEYWTLIRGAKVRGAPRVAKTCPACAAPLAINMAGNCEHCSVHVTSGEFDWVLSKIEQDEAYRG